MCEGWGLSNRDFRPKPDLSGGSLLLIAKIYCFVMDISIFGVTNFLFSILGDIYFRIFCFKKLILETNFGRSWLLLSLFRFWSYFSSSQGLGKVIRLRCWKKCLNSRRILFFYSIFSDTPFYSERDCSRYYFADILQPFLSLNWRAKSRRIHMKKGK